MITENSIPSGIKISNLTLTYQRHPAIHHLSGTFIAGTLNCIMGPNGGGKSTFLKCLAGLHPIDEGTIDRSPNLGLSQTAYLAQNQSWDRQFPLTVFELAAQGLIEELPFWKSMNSKQKNRVLESLDQVHLLKLKDEPIENLSLGQFQRALLARVIVQNAQVILLDEPLNGLDEPSINDLFKLLHDWQRQGKTIIVVLHDRELAAKHFEYGLFLNKEVKAWGPIKEIFNVPSIPSQNLNPAPLSSLDFFYAEAEDLSKKSLSDEECSR